MPRPRATPVKCEACGEEELHYAKGKCQRCYRREYSKRRRQKKNLTYGGLQELSKLAIADHLAALRSVRPMHEGESFEDWKREISQITGYLPVAQAEFCRKFIKDLHQMMQDGAQEDDVVTQDDEDVQKMLQVLEGNG